MASEWAQRFAARPSQPLSPPQQTQAEGGSGASEWAQRFAQRQASEQAPPAPVQPQPTPLPGATPEPTPSPLPMPSPGPAPLDPRQGYVHEERTPVLALPGEVAGDAYQWLRDKAGLRTSGEMLEEQGRIMDQAHAEGRATTPMEDLNRTAASALGLVAGMVEAPYKMALPAGRQIAKGVGENVVPRVPGSGETRDDRLQRQADRHIAPNLIEETFGPPVQTVVKSVLAPAAKAATGRDDVLPEEGYTLEEMAKDPVGVTMGPVFTLAPVVAGGLKARGARGRTEARRATDVAARNWTQQQPTKGSAYAVLDAAHDLLKKVDSDQRGTARHGELVDYIRGPERFDRRLGEWWASKVDEKVGAAKKKISEGYSTYIDPNISPETREFVAKAHWYISDDALAKKMPEMRAEFDRTQGAIAVFEDGAARLARDMEATFEREVRAAMPGIKRGQLRNETAQAMWEFFRLSQGEALDTVRPDSVAHKILKGNPQWFEPLNNLAKRVAEVRPDLLSEELRAANAEKRQYLPYLYQRTLSTAIKEFFTLDDTAFTKAIRETAIDSTKPDRTSRSVGLEQNRTALGRTKARRTDWDYQDRMEAGLREDPIYALTTGIRHLAHVVEMDGLQKRIAQRPDVTTQPFMRFGEKSLSPRQLIEAFEAFEDGAWSKHHEKIRERAEASGAWTPEVYLKARKLIREHDAAAPEGTVQLPHGGIFDRLYGDLAGAHVPRHLAFELNDLLGKPTSAGHLNFGLTVLKKTLKATGGFFKVSKTAWAFNVAAVNAMANIIQHDIGGFPVIEQAHYMAKAMKEMKEGGRLWREALEDGAVGGDFLHKHGISAAEIAANAAASGVLTGSPTGVGRVPFWLADVAHHGARWVRRTGRKPVEFYRHIDSFAKLSHYIYAREVLKLERGAAARRAQAAGLNYEKVSPFIRDAGAYATPFISFPYLYSKFLASNLAKHPVRTLKWVAIKEALDALGHSESEGEDPTWGFSGEAREQRAEERMGLSAPERVSAVRMSPSVGGVFGGVLGAAAGGLISGAMGARRGTTPPRLPIVAGAAIGAGGGAALSPARTEEGEPVDANLGRIIPWLIANRELDLTMPIGPWQLLAGPSHPAITEPGQIARNRDDFTGLEIMTPGASTPQRAMEILKHVSRTFGPGIAMELADTWRRTVGGETYYGQDRPASEDVRFRFGLQRPVTPLSGRAGAGLKTEREIREIEAYYRSLARRRGGLSDADRAEMQRRVQDTVDSNMNP